MTAFAHVGQRDRLRRTVEIYIGEDLGGGRLEADLGDGTRKIVDQYAGEELPPTITLREAEARALLQSLVTYYEGGENTRTLRKDYDAERARVDKMVETLSAIARERVMVVDTR